MPLIIFHARLGFAKFLRKWAKEGRRSEAAPIESGQDKLGPKKDAQPTGVVGRPKCFLRTGREAGRTAGTPSARRGAPRWIDVHPLQVRLRILGVRFNCT